MLERLGPYRLLRRLALGGTAEIWLGEAEGDSVAVAVKRMLPELRVHPEAIAMFEAEARLLARCAHPHVVRMVDQGRDGDDRWIAFEHVEGGDLTMAAGGLTTGLRVMGEVLAALEHVHRCGVVHADVNPHNVLLRAGGVAVLIDFGVASEIGGAGIKPARGTWAYMSPEQVRGDPMDGRSDVFACGVVLWELAAGRRLFRREQTWLTMAAVVEDDPPPLEDARLDAICRAALAKDRDRRTPTAAALAEEVAGYQASGGLAPRLGP